MNVKDKINKAAWHLVESVRDTTTRAIVTLAANKQIEIKPDDLKKLVSVINSTIESGFQNGSRVFERTVDEAVKEVASEKKEVKTHQGKKS